MARFRQEGRTIFQEGLPTWPRAGYGPAVTVKADL